MMPNPVSNEVWSVIGQWIVYGASISGAVMAIAQFIKWIRSKTTVARLEEIVNKHSQFLENDNKRIAYLEEQERRNTSTLEDMHNLNRLSVKALQALLKSNLDGNNRESVKEANDEIQKYLNEKI